MYIYIFYLCIFVYLLTFTNYKSLLSSRHDDIPNFIGDSPVPHPTRQLAQVWRIRELEDCRRSIRCTGRGCVCVCVTPRCKMTHGNLPMSKARICRKWGFLFMDVTIGFINCSSLTLYREYGEARFGKTLEQKHI